MPERLRNGKNYEYECEEKKKKKKVRVGIIGCGGIANGKHMPNLAKIAEVEMVAFCDIVEEKAVKAAEKFGTEDAKVYVNYKELLKDESIDVVHVCTPNRSHSFITVDALEAGKHVMCEKPMAKTYAEAKKMYDASVRTGKKLTIGYQQRWRGDSQYLKQVCQNGELGNIYYARAIALRRRAVPTWGVFFTEYEQGGGPLSTSDTRPRPYAVAYEQLRAEMVLGTKYKCSATRHKRQTHGATGTPSCTLSRIPRSASSL